MKPEGIFVGILLSMENDSEVKNPEGTFEKKVRAEEMPLLAKEVVEVMRVRPRAGACVITLSGPLGAGKTTFVQACAQMLGVPEVVTSPTFVVQKRYKTQDPDFDSLVHIDAYRIEDLKELTVLHFEELLKEARTLVMIEWPERMAPLLFFERYTMTLGHLEENVRQVAGKYTT